jgi:NADH:ubiquinone oxidoreductase subunit K
MSYFSLFFFFIFSILIFFIGILGLVVAKKNNFLLLISLEIIFIAINLNFLIGSVYLDDFAGIIFVIFTLVVSGAEVSVGLALFIPMYKRLHTFSSYNMINIKG